MELQREALIDVAMGYAPADTVIANGRVVNVHTGTVKAEGIALKGERIAYDRIGTKGLAYMTQDRFELAELFVE